METHEHKCITCVYLFTDASKPITISDRNTIFNDKTWDSGMFSFDYFKIRCRKKRLKLYHISKNIKADIREEIIKKRKCKHWSQFDEGVSATMAENRELSIQSISWKKWAVLVAIVGILVAVIGILSQTLPK